MDPEVAKALKSIQKDLKDIDDQIDAMKDADNNNASILSKLIDVVDDLKKRVTKLEK